MRIVSPTLAAPEVGQLVRVRDRHWVVTNVVASSLDTSAGTPSHLIELSSVEDDAYGDELTVFWEVEPGTVVLPKATLPQPAEGFDAPGRLAAFLDAVRWGESRPPMPVHSKRPSEAASPSRTTSSIPSSGRCRCRA